MRIGSDASKQGGAPGATADPAAPGDAILSITTITTHLEPGAELAPSLVAPFALAEAFSAHLTALVFAADATAAATPEQEEAAIAHLRDAAARRGIACELRGRSSFAHGIGEVLGDHMRVSDLGVITLRGTPGPAAGVMLGGAIFGTGRPVLLSPAAAPLAALPRRVLVAWDASPASVRAVHGALPLILRAEETIVVSVTGEKELRPGQSGIALTQLLARHGASARFAAMPQGSSVLATLATAAIEHGAGLVTMGAVRHAPLHDLIFGSATRDLLDRGPPLPILIAA